ncbi:D-proline reductase (dithiol) proprotein PrdA [Halanaerobium salsuginis]|jgi:D-proline reductase (dithiol) PrdA|uniref:D-proline reductase (Dithiol) PrdA n=1 Tax=Halanaerobium salsuginis TaxID=29563 RepID=A0A1I4FQK4_9FIRM|nr:D-proline reductase (dithiol) proprotein PrdA [Halanaerobium salsuginis]SFL19257.1 D-proline reductase (dithiol) PrdA [Halanaerobium salsuginis]
MSITNETAQEHINDLAVLCCRTEEGTILAPSNLEDPNILPDLEDSGLLEIPSDNLKIGEVLGAKLLKTVDSLTPLTPDLLEGIKELTAESESEEDQDNKNQQKKISEQSSSADNLVEDQIKSKQTTSNFSNGIVKIHIGEGKDINLEIPIGLSGVNAGENTIVNSNDGAEHSLQSEKVESPAEESLTKEINEDKKIRSLTKKHFQIDEVEIGDETKIEGTTLYLRENICQDAVGADDLVCSIKFDIITPADYDKYSETIMDVQPIATKEEDCNLGEGVTRVLDGVVIVVTGTDETGVQIGEFGSSEGILERNIMWNRPGAPDKGEIFIKTEVIIKEKTNMERPGPLAAHKASDFITQEIRNALKEVDDSLVTKEEELTQYRRPAKKKVVIIKEIMGQGAMHDNIILPIEPVGILGGEPNVDLGNVPLVLSPLEVLDGGIHALTCIGPASKETSRHYWREPLVKEIMADDELDLAGIVFVGSPQANSEKFYVSKRLGMLVETMDVDGAFITTEGFGNNHIDFASHHEQVGMRGVPVVGMSFCAEQGALVVGNKYMKYMIDNNKSEQGIENEILSNNTLCPEDAVRAAAMLKAAMFGADVKEAERHFNHHVKDKNIDLIEEETTREVELVPNEQILPKSKKRQEIYDTDE